MLGIVLGIELVLELGTELSMVLELVLELVLGLVLGLVLVKDKGPFNHETGNDRIYTACIVINACGVR